MKKVKKIRKAIKKINEYIPLITVIVSAISVLVTGLFKAGAYLYCKGYYDFWNIPADYITLNYQNLLYNFLLTMGIVTICIGLSNLYVFAFKKILKKEKLFTKIIQCVGMILVVPLLVIVIFVVYLMLEFPIGEIIGYVRNAPGHFAANVALVSFLLLLAIFGTGQMLSVAYAIGKEDDKNEECSDEEKRKEETEKGYQDRIIIFVLIVFFATIMCTGYSIYKQGEQNVAQKKNIDMVFLDEKTYIIVGQYGESWILKECIYSDEQLRINSEHYMISNIENKDIVKISIKDEDNVEGCVVDNATYEKLEEELK